MPRHMIKSKTASKVVEPHHLLTTSTETPISCTFFMHSHSCRASNLVTYAYAYLHIITIIINSGNQMN